MAALAFNEAALRPPARRSTRQQRWRFIRQETRVRWLTLPTPRDPRNANEVGLKFWDSFCMCAQEVGRSTVRRLRGGPPLRALRLLTFFVRPSAAPVHRKKRRHKRRLLTH